jgi:hypothetical protein
VRAMHDTIKGWMAETGLEVRPHSEKGNNDDES